MLFATLNPEQIQEMAGRAASLERDYRGPNLLSYFAIDCPPEVDPAALAKALTAWRNVQSAYVDGGPVPPPQVNAADDPRWPNQGYLDPAPAGIDAEYAWTITGGDGTGIRFIAQPSWPHHLPRGSLSREVPSQTAIARTDTR